VACELYDPLRICPSSARTVTLTPLLADENATFGSPADLFIIPDHYVFRMLYSQGVRWRPSAFPAAMGPQHRPAPADLANLCRSLLPFSRTPAESGWRMSCTRCLASSKS